MTTNTAHIADQKPVPYWQSECGRATVYVGDCKEILSRMESEQFHAVLTDPPYGLEFMNEEWDAPWKNSAKIETCSEGTDASHPFRDGSQRVCYGNTSNSQDSKLYQEWFEVRAAAILRVAKPGAHLMSFGGTRMWHRMTCAVEDAGFEIRDTLMWVYGSGFSKGRDVSKDIDKLLCGERTEKDVVKRNSAMGGIHHSANIGAAGYRFKEEYGVSDPITEDAKRWAGWGSTLKPAVEPVLLARKPLSGSIAENTMEYGCGGLNMDGCRVGTDEMEKQESNGIVVSNNTSMAGPNTGRIVVGTKVGRLPANFIHDGSNEVLSLLPQGAGRYFYSAKADESDRPHGKDGTIHPTVKPLDLMRYLARLICAPGGLILDPFMGSGSTGCAAVMEGMRFVGIELSEEYADIAVGRIRLALEQYSGKVSILQEKVLTDRVKKSTKNTLPTSEKLAGHE